MGGKNHGVMCKDSVENFGIVPLTMGEYRAELYWMHTEILEYKTQFDHAYHSLSSRRQKKVDAFLYAKDKKLSLGAGLMLRKGLAARGIQEREAVFAYGENGKPYLPEYPEVHFNLSHSGQIAAAVFADCEVGCDVELVERADMDLARRFFSKKEYQYLTGFMDERQRNQAFYRLWTLKESFVKAIGAGLMLPLDAFEILVKEDGQIAVCQSVDTASYRFLEYCILEYQISVCLRTV